MARAPVIRLRAITWDHRRAIDPLVNTFDLFARAHPGIAVEWSSRPLHGFEFTSVSELTRDNDLIVFDHPFVGEVAASGCLLPLELPDLDGSFFVGHSLESYVYDGRLWAVPIDAACQVAVSRPDLMALLDLQAPSDWSSMIALGRTAARTGRFLAMALRGVHGLMTFFTLCANLGKPCGTDRGCVRTDHDTARTVLAMLRELVSLCPADCVDWNSIAVHERMVARDDLVYCPAVYCYATYAEMDQRRPLRFHDLPGPCGPGGSTLGGTGLGISARCRHPAAARAYASFAATPAAQLAFARHHGQPALAAAWEDDEVNVRFGHCYRAVRQTMERSWTRPRYHGYLAFQARAGELIEQHLRGIVREADLLDEFERLGGEQG